MASPRMGHNGADIPQSFHTDQGTQTMKKLLTMICVAGMAIQAFATERTWVGESGGSWYVAANWSPSGVPAATDTVVFSPESETTVTISGGTSVCRVEHIRFESGTTYFAYDSSAIGIYMGGSSGSATNTLYVADGAYAVVSNRFLSLNNNTRRFRKTGGGRLTIVSRTNDWWSYGAYNFKGCDFAEGETILAKDDGNYPLASYPIHVCSGAVVRCTASYRLRKTQNLTIDYGGVLNCGGAAQYAQSITGAGVVTNHEALTITLNTGVCTFAGQFFKKATGSYVGFDSRPSGMSDEDWGFVIGGADTFSQTRLSQPSGAGNTIRFAPGVGDFWIDELIGSTKQYLVLEDTNGDPVTVRGGFYNSTTVPMFKGKGNFLCTKSCYIQSSGVVTNMTGALGVCKGQTLTIGNDTAATWPNISGLGGFIVENGIVALKNANVEDSTVRGTNVFCHAWARMTATADLKFGAGSTVRFEITRSGLGSGVVPIKAPGIVFDATTTLAADVSAYRETIKKKTTLKLAEATSTLNLPNDVLENANANSFANGYRFRKDGNTLLLDVRRSGGLMITFR